MYVYIVVNVQHVIPLQELMINYVPINDEGDNGKRGKTEQVQLAGGMNEASVSIHSN
ncbi:hypothetical protein [Kaarinaea lacus]